MSIESWQGGHERLELKLNNNYNKKVFVNRARKKCSVLFERLVAAKRIQRAHTHIHILFAQK